MPWFVKALVGYSCLVLKPVSMLFNVIPLLGRKLFKVCLACLFKVVIFLNLIEVRFAMGNLWKGSLLCRVIYEKLVCSLAF